ncbi:hypothetical protein BH23GEM6_BH23GEM6_18550 [soil metagenome]
MRGQLTFLLPQPELEYSYIAGGSYMFPRSDGVLLGGTSEPGEWSVAPNPATTRQILEGNRRVTERMNSVPER